MRYLFLLFINFICLNLSFANISTFSEIKDRGFLKIAIYVNKPPFGYLDNEGKPQGFDIEIAKILAKDLFGDENKIKFIYTVANDRVKHLKTGNADIILANYTKTAHRAKAVSFANPYLKVSLGVISNNGKIKSLNDLKGKTLLVNAGTTGEEYFVKSKFPEINIVSFKSNSDALSALQKGEGDALVHNNTLLWAWANQNPNYEVGISHLGDKNVIAPAVDKNNKELLEWINSEIDLIKKDGRLLSAYEKVLLPIYGDKISAKDLLAD